MNKYLISIPIVILVLLLVVFFVRLTSSYSSNPISSEKILPESIFQLIDKPSLGLTSPGNIFLINVWATWCSTCLDEYPFLIQLSDEYPIVGLNLKDDMVKIDGWYNKYGNPFVYSIVDEKGFFAIDLGIKAVPETLFIKVELSPENLKTAKIIARHRGKLNQQKWLEYEKSLNLLKQ